jgi:hypothetical protein
MPWEQRVLPVSVPALQGGGLIRFWATFEDKGGCLMGGIIELMGDMGIHLILML